MVPFEEAEDNLHEQLFEKKMEQVREEWSESARRQAVVKILLIEDPAP